MSVCAIWTMVMPLSSRSAFSPSMYGARGRGRGRSPCRSRRPRSSSSPGPGSALRIDQRLQPVDAVDDQRPEGVLLGVERRQRLHHLVEGPGEREVRHVERAEPVLGQDEHRDPARRQRRWSCRRRARRASGSGAASAPWSGSGRERDGHHATSGARWVAPATGDASKRRCSRSMMSLLLRL